MSVSTVASRYAKSLIDLAKEKDVVDTVYKDMLLFKHTAAENRALGLALASPVVRHEKKLGILAGLFKDKVDPVSYSIFNIITRKHRESILSNIADEFIKQYDTYKGIQKALITSSTALTDELRVKFIDIISKATGKTVELEEKVDPDLIGGFVIRVGDQQLDTSLRNALNELKLKFQN